MYWGVDDEQSIYPLYISNKICDLLLIENHYVRIKDFNKLMNTQSKDGHLLLLFATFHIKRNTNKSCQGLP